MVTPSSTGSLDVRMCIRVDSLRSRSWRLRCGARRPEVFIEREGLERAVHVSLHESGRWHVKVWNKAKYEWLRPDELQPGYTRATVIVQPPAVALFSETARPGTVIVDLAKGTIAAHFNVFLERPGANTDTWPGRNAMGTEFIARLPLADGAGTCCIVLQRAAAPAGSATFPLQDGVEELQKLAKIGELFATILGEEADGAVTLLDLRTGGPSACP
jgi:hypothetical protein